MVGQGQMWILNLLTPLFRLIDPILPLPGLDLIGVLVPSAVASVKSDLRIQTADLDQSRVVR